jgi:hypothetical protein
MNGFQKKICTAFTLTFAVLGLGLSAAGYAADGENQALFDKTHRAYNQLLQDNVNNGMVNYAALVGAHDGSLPILAAYLGSLAAVAQDDFETWEVSEQLAFMVNLYNAATLQLIVDNYPVDSIKEIGWWAHNAWKKKIINLFGRHISLDCLEHDIIRAQFQ